jgi:nickel-dependent lactate racemase
MTADGVGFSGEALRGLIAESAASIGDVKRVLLIPPDFTRVHSCAGEITRSYYESLKDRCAVDILPALGTHAPMTEAARRAMFGDIPAGAFIVHRFRDDVVRVGRVPAEFVREVSGGFMDEPIEAEVNARLLSGYDLILSIGQVVPHEVVGMANRNKNIFVGCGGERMINASHMLGAVYGMERVMGRDFSPVRRVFDYAEEHFLKELPIVYVLTVTTADEGGARVRGLFIGRERSLFEQAVALSRRLNVTLIETPIQKAVCYLSPDEFKTTWVGNKAIYRTRMAIPDGGELVILAPGVERFGEDAEMDRLIRRYGYCGRAEILRRAGESAELQKNLSAAAHLIHGSSDGRFKITYATEKLTRSEVRGVHFHHMPYGEAIRAYDPARLREGYNELPGGETIFFIGNPATGLWAERTRFDAQNPRTGGK